MNMLCLDRVVYGSAVMIRVAYSIFISESNDMVGANEIGNVEFAP